MYFDKERNLSYLHNHAVYVCACGKVIATCPCPDQSDKEELVFETCSHDGTRYTISDKGKWKVSKRQKKKLVVANH